jgi:hypothetical protein
MTQHKKCQMPGCTRTINSLHPRIIVADNNRTKDKFGNWTEEKKWDRRSGSGADHRVLVEYKHKNLKVCESCWKLIDESTDELNFDTAKSVKISKIARPIDSFIQVQG